MRGIPYTDKNESLVSSPTHFVGFDANWIKNNISNIFDRLYSSFSDIANISDVVIGEEYNLKVASGASAKYTVKKDYNKKSLSFLGNSTNVFGEDMSYNGVAIDIATSDNIEITIKVSKNGINPLNTGLEEIRLFSFDASSYLMLRENNGTLSFGGNGFSVNSLKNENGDTVTKLIPDRWITINLSVLSPVTSFTPRMLQYAKAGMNFDILSFKIDGETFNFNGDPDSKTWISDSGNNRFVAGSGFDATITTEEYIPDSPMLINTPYALFETEIIGNIIDPTFLGLDTSINSKLEFVNDAYPILQYCIDSPYSVNIPPGKYYISQGLEVTKAKEITMLGEGVPVVNGRSAISDSNIFEEVLKDNSTSIIYSNNDIDYITIKSRNVIINKGLLYTALSIDHSKAAYKYDINYPIWGGSLNYINVVGSYVDLLRPGFGTTGIYFNTDAVEDSATGYFTMLKISGVIHFCTYGVNLPANNPLSSIFINSSTFDINMHTCKMFYNIENGSLFKFSGIMQDNGVLDADNKDVWACNFTCSSSTIDIFVFDRFNNINDGGIELTPHETNNILVKGLYNNVIGNSSLHLLKEKSIKGLNFNSIGEHSFIMNSNTKIVSSLDNQIRFLGEKNSISFKAYDGDEFGSGATWFDANLYPADDVLNTETLTENNLACSIVNEGLLTEAGENRLTSYTINDGFTYGFAEVILPLPYEEKLRGLYVTIFADGGIDFSITDRIQVILRNTNKPLQDPFVVNITSEELGYIYRGSYRIPIQGAIVGNLLWNNIVIRFIGNSRTEQTIFLQDISLTTQYQPTKNVITTNGGTIIGDLNLEDTSGVPHTIKPKLDTTPSTVSELVTLLKSTGIIY